MVQWLGLGTFTALAWVRSLVGGTEISQSVWCSQKNKEVKKIHLEKEMATHSSILPWETPRTEEPG